MKNLHVRLAALALAMSAGLAAQAAQPQYRVQNLSSQWPSGRMWGSVGLNNEGTVFGSLQEDAGRPGQPFLVHHGTTKLLGALDGPWAIARAINDRGELTGIAASQGSGAWRPFLYRRAEMVEIPTPPGGRYAQGLDINSAGQVLGVAGPSLQEAFSRPFIYDGTRTRFLDLPEGYSLERLNDRGQMLGTAFDARTGITRPFLYEDGRITLLPLLQDAPMPQERAVLRGIDFNNAGQVLVRLTDRADLTGRNVSSYLYSDGAYTRIGPAGSFEAVDINRKGWVTGTLTAPDWSGHRPALYRDGRLLDLNDLLVPAGARNGELRSALALNDRGQILGTGNRGHYLATPVPEPATPALMLAGLAIVGTVLRRRSAVR
ncbi:PEP-CTERM sorting domain-containing protein [Azohydromonas caseinilytica]|uniref:PEP-CTERM sorting domain-containing protein n=1 Tax=Azohydromonas caseinilytica TaxID=2728836 RepID=UPI001F38BC63|nr:PEP-CTERM sorting domain-containing protein [Azohydromonas caseinilytica]